MIPEIDLPTGGDNPSQYDDVLGLIINMINLFNPKNSPSIKLGFTSKEELDLYSSKLFIEMAATLSPIIDKPVEIYGVSFWERRAISKRVGYKFKKAKVADNILDVIKLTKILIDTGKECGLVLSPRIFKETYEYYQETKKGNYGN